ncbi:MAG: hypothetical protein KDI48_14810 [Xanthomonadales bacterium]|nr:hypothetical protein [Xanthomonadales bacterium]
MDTLKWLLLSGAVLLVGHLAYRVIRFGGFKAALFGAPIASTVARIVGSDQGTVKMPLTVYRLGGNDPDKVVGLALEASSFASYQTLTVSLSESKVRELIQSLQSALGNGETEAG